MMKKVAIVGANAYIARNLIHFMHSKSNDYQLKLYDIQDEHMDKEKCYLPINISDEKSVMGIDFDCDFLFMFVGKTGTLNAFDEIDTFIDINEKAMLNVLNAHQKKQSKAKIVFPSTRLVYKGVKGSKLKECDEKEFKTIYAINKYACEQYLQMYQRVHGVPYNIFRICVPYGTLIKGASSYGTAEFMLSRATKGENIPLYGDGKIRRTLIFIEDLCHFLLEGAQSQDCINDVYNIGGEDYSLLEMAEKIAFEYNVKVEHIPWPEKALLIESGDTVFDSEKLESIIGSYKYKKFADWCKEQRTIVA